MKPLKIGKPSLKGRILRLLGKDGGFELPFQSREEAQADVSINYKEFRNALLEVETKKAQALMQWEKHRSTFQ